jgi:hypothetical protein
LPDLFKVRQAHFLSDASDSLPMVERTRIVADHACQEPQGGSEQACNQRCLMEAIKYFTERKRVHELTVTLTYADTTSTKAFMLPKNARMIEWIINAKTAFSGGTAELDIGSSSDPDAYADGISLAAAGRVYPTTEIVQPGYRTTKTEDVYMNAGAGNTAGEVDVTLLFSFPMDQK